MNTSERFNQMRAEYDSKKAEMSSAEFAAYEQSINDSFDRKHGNQAYADLSDRQMAAQRALEEQVARREAQIRAEKEAQDWYDTQSLRALLFED